MPLSAFVLSVAFLSCGENEADNNSAADPWVKADSILQLISPPEILDQRLSVADFGATGDGQSDDLPAFRAAIDSAAAMGGGQVFVPGDTFFLGGPVHLKSGIDLHLDEGAYVKFSTNPDDYLPLVFTRWEGVECMNYSPLIYAIDQENIAVTGKGTFDGQASDENWWPWKRVPAYEDLEGMDTRFGYGREGLLQANIEQAPPEERIFGKGHYLRPNFIQFYRCENVMIEDVTFRNSPMWIMHPVLCENVIVRGVRVISHGPNSDGCDPESCRNVLIENCYFDTGDDCIALKSGRNYDGRRIARPIESVIVRNCEMKDGHGGVVIGSEVSGGARNIFAENCIMDSPNLDRAIRIKTNRSRGGFVEGVYVRNIEVGEVKEAVVKVNMHYTLDDSVNVFMPRVEDVWVENVTSEKSRYGLYFHGYDEENPVRGIHILNSKFEGVERGNFIENAVDIEVKNLTINGNPVDSLKLN